MFLPSTGPPRRSRERLKSSQADIALGRLSLRCIADEEFELSLGEVPYDIAVAVRVGAVDGRRLKAGERAGRRIAAALRPQGCLLIDGGNPLRQVPLDDRGAPSGL